MASTTTRRIVAEISARNKSRGEMAAFRNDIKRTTQSIKTLAVGLVGTYGLKYAFQDVTRAAIQQERAERRLQVLMSNVPGTTQGSIDAIKEYADQLQRTTVIGDEVTISGASQLATFQMQSDTVRRLIPVMQDLAVATYGVTVGQDQMIQSANLIGKVMMGQVGAMTRVGVSFSDLEKEMIKNGNESQRLDAVVSALRANFGGLASDTGGIEGAMAQYRNELSDVKEEVGFLIAKEMELIEVMRGAAHLMRNDKDENASADEKRLYRINQKIGAINAALSGRMKDVSTVHKYMLALDQGYLESDEKFRERLLSKRAQLMTEMRAMTEKLWPDPGLGQTRRKQRKQDAAGRYRSIYRQLHPETPAEGGFQGNAKAAESVDTTTAALERQIRVLEMVKDGRAANAKAAEFHLTAEEAFGKGTKEYTAAVERYGAALEKITAARASDRMADIELSLDRQIETTGRLGRAWENSAQYAEYHKLAAERFGEGTAEYERSMDSLEAKFAKLEMAERWNSAMESMAEGTADAIGEMLFEGKNFEDGMRNVFRSVAQAAFTEGLKIMMIKMAARVFASEKGNVFSNGRIQRFDRGGVVERETAFSLAGGDIGTMAEGNKPEAIMPLARGTDGRLGVLNQGGGGGGPIHNNLKVVNMLDASVVTDAMGSKQGERVIMNVLRKNRGALRNLN